MNQVIYTLLRDDDFRERWHNDMREMWCRDIKVMSICIAISAEFSGNIVTIMACVFMTVATILMLVTTRRVMKIRKKKQQKNLQQ